MQRQKPRQQALLWLVAGALSVVLGCGSTTEPESPRAGGTVEFVASVPQALAGEEVRRLVVTLSAADIPARSVSLVLSNGVWSGTFLGVPQGTDRTFLAEAFDATSALRYRGQATGVTVTEGVTTLVAMTLQSVGSGEEFVNSAPCIDQFVVPSLQVFVGESVSLTPAAHDPDPSDTLSYAWTASGGTFSSTTTASTTWTAPQTAGTYVVTWTVTDSRGAIANISASIRVVDPNGPGLGSVQVTVGFTTSPHVQRIVNSRSPVPLGQPVSVTVSAVDDDGDALSYQWTSSCEGSWADSTSRTATFTPSAAPPPGQNCNNCALTVTVTDSQGASNQGTLLLCVDDDSTTEPAPIIESTYQSATTVTGGRTVTLRVIARDPNAGALSFSWNAGLGGLGVPSSGASYSEVVWTAPQCTPVGGVAAITVTVSNVRGRSVSHTFNVTVQGSTNCPPPTTGQWAPTGSMLIPRYGHSATLLPDGRVLVLGGADAASIGLASAELYVPDTGSWLPAGNMSVPREQHTVTLLPDGRVLVIGGSTGGPYNAFPTTSVDTFHPATGTWTAVAPMIYPRLAHTATLLPDGRVLVIGGSSQQGVSNIPEVYDPATNTWMPLNPMAAPSRLGHQAVLLPSGRVLVVGGGHGAELYDVARDLWSPATGVSSPNWAYAYLQPSGRVLLTQGRGVALYDPALNTETPVGEMIYERSYFAQTMLASGRLLLTGGSQPTSALTEIFDPVTRASSRVLPMPTTRYFHTATLLRSGRVLIAGGHDGAAITNTALLYTP
jgi:hypothetical protein